MTCEIALSYYTENIFTKAITGARGKQLVLDYFIVLIQLKQQPGGSGKIFKTIPNAETTAEGVAMETGEF